MTSSEIRKKYIEFFKSKGHKEIPSASLLPENDSSSLFIGSGMQPLIPYLLGEKHPCGVRLTNTQKSFRQIDIEEVGDHRHNTFFEMIGNWSLGDYFKREQLTWIFEFLTKKIGLDPKRIYVSVYRGNDGIGIPMDTESVEIWKELFASAGIVAKDADFAEKNGMQGGKIFYYSDKKNWWSRSGEPQNMPIGEPGGPDSEIFYDLGENLHCHENSKWKDDPCHINCDCGRFIEIGNNVFMEYIKTESGFKKLPQKNVDFGGGLERIVMVAQGKNNIFQTDLFTNIINKIKGLSGKNYDDNSLAFEIIADHLKAAVFIMGDDAKIAPSNVKQGYTLRRLIRRAIGHGRELGIFENYWTKKIADEVINIYKDIYPELKRNYDFIIKSLDIEEEKFSKTIDRGIKELRELCFPSYNTGEFKIMAVEDEEKNKSIAQSKQITGKELFKIYSTYGLTIDLSIEELERLNKTFQYSDITEQEKQTIIKEFDEEMKKHQELSRTASAGMFKGGLADAGEQTTKYHTATHLLHQALRQVLGEHVQQKGSNINAERLRFDFSHPEKMTAEQIAEVEKIVNSQIQKNLPVYCEEMGVEEAKSNGALGFFESKYGEKVKVYSIGSSISEGGEFFSREICGGPHVKNIGELGLFKIKKEEASSAGIRRIKAVLV